MEKKTDIINNELLRLKVDIAALHCVGFAVKNTLLQHVEVVSDDNERITTLQTKKGIVAIVSIYARTPYYKPYS